MDVASIARSGLSAASARLGVAASNIANQQSRAAGEGRGASVGVSGAPSVPLRAVQTSSPGGTEVTVRLDDGAVTSLYDPGSPYADGRGIVAVPDVNLLHETVDLVMATFAFHANLAVLQTGDEMTRSFLDAAASRGGSRFDP